MLLIIIVIVILIFNILFQYKKKLILSKPRYNDIFNINDLWIYFFL